MKPSTTFQSGGFIAPPLEKMRSSTMTQTVSSFDSTNAQPLSPILPSSPLQRTVKFGQNTPFEATGDALAGRLSPRKFIHCLEESKSSAAEDIFCESIDQNHCCDFIDQHFGDIYFDRMTVTASNGKICAVSSHGLRRGAHEWSLKILRCDVHKIEVGVVGTADIAAIEVSDGGVMATAALAARAVYGNELSTDSAFYCSFNRNGKERCFKDVSLSRTIGWTQTDVITVCLDVDRGRIKFLVNGLKVRKTLSIQQQNVYHPVVCFGGDCRFALTV